MVTATGTMMTAHSNVVSATPTTALTTQPRP